MEVEVVLGDEEDADEARKFLRALWSAEEDKTSVHGIGGGRIRISRPDLVGDSDRLTDVIRDHLRTRGIDVKRIDRL